MRRFRDILSRAEDIQGVPFAELAEAHGIRWAGAGASRKGLTGIMSQACFGVPMDSEPEPDIKELAIEIKSVPVDVRLRVMERTKITALTAAQVREQDWPRSRVYHKLRTILFVPVVKPSKEAPEDWYFRTPFIWMPSLERERQLEEDYEAVRQLVIAGRPQDISTAMPPAGQGKYLVANTSGANSEDLTNWGTAGNPLMERRRAWMLRREFVQQLIDENVRYRL